MHNSGNNMYRKRCKRVNYRSKMLKVVPVSSESLTEI